MADTVHRNRVGIALGIATLVVAMFFAGRHSALNSAMRAEATPVVTVVATREHVPVAEVVLANRPQETLVKTPAWSDGDWQKLSEQLRTPARVSEMATKLEKLAAADPRLAMSLAQTEGNLKTRDLFTQAVLRGWAGAAPEAAAGWALKLVDNNAREAAMRAVFAGATARPDEAIRIAALAGESDPANAISFGNLLIDAFCEKGNFQTAAEFALAASPENQSFWMAQAYSKWSALQPETAAQAAMAISDPDLRDEALHGIIGGWSEADPVGLTKFVTQLPAGEEHGQMLGQALQSWVRVDPVAASDWMNANTSEPDMDEGVASVARMNGLDRQVAVSWAESVADKKLRSQVLGEILRAWVLEDQTGAKKYFETTANLQPGERKEIGEILTTAFQLNDSSNQPSNKN